MAAQGRHGARRLLVQALYQHQIADHPVEELIEQFSARPEFDSVDTVYFDELLRAVLADLDQLDAEMATFADRPVEQLDPVERAVLWLGLTEIKLRRNIPARVILNEAIELTKQFGAEDGYRYVNAVLDKAARTVRGSASG